VNFQYHVVVRNGIVALFGALALASCTSSTEVAAWPAASLAAFRVSERTPTGVITYSRASAKLYTDNGGTLTDGGVVTLNGGPVPFEASLVSYRADTVSDNGSFDEWAVSGSASVPSFSIKVSVPPTLAILEPAGSALLKLDSNFRVTWAPVVSGSSVGVEIDDSLGETFSSIVSDSGSATFNSSSFERPRSGTYSIYIYRVAKNTVQSGSRVYTAQSERDARVDVTLLK
jgi:hypothetical protein